MEVRGLELHGMDPLAGLDSDPMTVEEQAFWSQVYGDKHGMAGMGRRDIDFDGDCGLHADGGSPAAERA